jgi:hypothetical protein
MLFCVSFSFFAQPQNYELRDDDDDKSYEERSTS